MFTTLYLERPPQKIAVNAKVIGSGLGASDFLDPVLNQEIKNGRRASFMGSSEGSTDKMLPCSNVSVHATVIF